MLDQRLNLTDRIYCLPLGCVPSAPAKNSLDRDFPLLSLLSILNIFHLLILHLPLRPPRRDAPAYP